MLSIPKSLIFLVRVLSLDLSHFCRSILFKGRLHKLVITFKIYILTFGCIYLHLAASAARGPCFSCGAWASHRCGFSCCGAGALECRLSSCGTPAYLPQGMWGLPWPRIEPRSPALEGRLLYTGPPGKSSYNFFPPILWPCVDDNCFLDIFTYLAAPGFNCGMWDL